MMLQEILAEGGAVFIILATLIQIAPININPWSAIVKGLGKVINADVLKELKDVQNRQIETKSIIDDHIEVDDKRDADLHRMRILQFNTELLRNNKHTQEDFIEALKEIDEYESYCKEHPKYENNRATHAINNIKYVYSKRSRKRNFLK